MRKLGLLSGSVNLLAVGLLLLFWGGAFAPQGDAFMGFVRSFEWEYVSDDVLHGHDLWMVSSAHKGDCEDYVLTIWVEWNATHPGDSQGWLILTPGHAVGMITTDGYYYVVSVGRLPRRFRTRLQALRFVSRSWGDLIAWVPLPAHISVDCGVTLGLRERLVYVERYP